MQGRRKRNGRDNSGRKNSIGMTRQQKEEEEEEEREKSENCVETRRVLCAITEGRKKV